MISFVQWLNRCPSTNNKQIRKSAPKIPKCQRRNSRKHHKFILLSLIPPSGCLFPIQIYLFLGGMMDHIMRSFLQTKNTHTNTQNSLERTPPTLFPNQTAFQVFPTSRCFPFGEVRCCQGAKYSKNSSAKNTLLGNSAIMFTWRKKR